jgi:hypothetical protein
MSIRTELLGCGAVEEEDHDTADALLMHEDRAFREWHCIDKLLADPASVATRPRSTPSTMMTPHRARCEAPIAVHRRAASTPICMLLSDFSPSRVKRCRPNLASGRGRWTASARGAGIRIRIEGFDGNRSKSTAAPRTQSTEVGRMMACRRSFATLGTSHQASSSSVQVGEWAPDTHSNLREHGGRRVTGSHCGRISLSARTGPVFVFAARQGGRLPMAGGVSYGARWPP